MKPLDFSGLTAPADAIAARADEGLRTPWGPIRVGVDGMGHRHVLVPVPAKLKLRSDHRSGGIHIDPRLLEEDGTVVPFLDIACRKPALFDLFQVIAGEMLDGLNRDPQPPDAICIGVLDRWRALLAAEASDAPSLELLEGLFGELQHLLALAHLGNRALRAWTGPDKATQDFRGPGCSLEVKATTRRAGWVVGISSVDQLDAPPGVDLFLSVWKLEVDDASGTSVPELIEQVRARGIDAAELYERVSRAGLPPAGLEAARAVRFRVLGHRVWPVTGAFPRIVASSFVGGALPVGIATLQYSLDLTALTASPAEVAALAALHQRLLGSEP
jgi:hypothetical protein